MADEKMAPLSAILHELRRHCEKSGLVSEMLLGEQEPGKREVLIFGLMSENTSIAALCKVLEISIIPPEEIGRVITELEALRKHYNITPKLIEKLKRR